MKIESIIKIAALRFSVTVQAKNGDTGVLHIILTKDQLRAAQTVGQSSKELIRRLCEQKDLTVLGIGKAERKTVSVDLDTLWGV